MPKTPIKSEKHSITIVVVLIITLVVGAVYVYLTTPRIESSQVAHTESQS